MYATLVKLASKIRRRLSYKSFLVRKIAGQINVFAYNGIPIFLDENGVPRVRLELGPIPDPVFVCTIPKSGTYMYAELLTKMGLIPTNLHISTWGCSDLRFASKKMARTAPEELLRSSPIDLLLDSIQQGQFAVGHLPYNEFCAKLLGRFKIVFTYRDLRDTLISFMRYMAKNGLGTARSDGWGNWPEGAAKFERYLELHGEEFFKMILPMKGWLELPNVFALEYEQVMGDYGETVQTKCIHQLISFLGIKYQDDSQQLLRDVLNCDTLTYSGSRSKREKYWSKKAEAFFEEHGGVMMQEYLIRYGGLR